MDRSFPQEFNAAAPGRIVTPCLTMRMFAALYVSALLLIAAPQLALGQAQSPDQLIEAGVAARRGGDDERALVLFTQAWASGHSPRARAQMGLAEQALGKFVDAEAHLSEALAAPGDAWITARRSRRRSARCARGESLRRTRRRSRPQWS